MVQKQAVARNRKKNKAGIMAKLEAARASRARGQAPAATAPLPPVPVTHTPPPSTSSMLELSTSSSASKRKLGFLRDEDKVTPAEDQAFSTSIVHIETLQHLFRNVVCGECLTGKVTLQECPLQSKGLAIKLRTVCEACGSVCGATHTSRKVSSQAFEVNRSIVTASLSVGVGHNQLSKMCEVMGMPSLHHKTHMNYVQLSHSMASKTSDDILASARKIVREAYGAVDPNVIIDISVTFDGTWHKRGHTSNHGVGIVIDALTGLVIDSHVMSLYCRRCKTIGAKIKNDDPQKFEQWLQQHKPSCQKNHTGSSGSMEVEAARVMWGRSLAFGLRYTTLISDGDAKTFSALKEMKPYGDTHLEKAECVNHVAKRLGTALRNLVNDEKKRGITLGGRGAGTLTQEKIGKLQSFYTKAVRTYNGSVEEMTSAVWAAFYHSISTDAAPQHMKCPAGEESWCFFQRACSLGQPPPSHNGHISTSLNTKVAPYVKKVYERLTDPELMRKCLSGKTQNPNESLHAQIWLGCPKHVFVTRPRIETATSLAIAEWNQGSQGTYKFMTALKLPVSTSVAKRGSKRDFRRVQQAEGAREESAKRRRETRKSAAQKASAEALARDQTLGQDYSAGAGD